MLKPILTFFIIAFLLASYFILDSRTGLETLHPEVSVSRNITCSLTSGSCEIPIAGGSISVNLRPRSLPALKPLTIEVKSPNGLGQDSVLWFEGRDMEMGQHHLSASKDGENVQVYNGMIPVCSVDQDMIWQLHVVAKFNDEWQEWIFDLSPSVGSEG